MRKTTYENRYRTYQQLVAEFGTQAPEVVSLRKNLNRAWKKMVMDYAVSMGAVPSSGLVAEYKASLNPTGTVSITVYYDSSGYSDPGSFFWSKGAHRSYLYTARKVNKDELYK